MNPGDILVGRYRLDRLLGAGGFGVVYLGTQMPLGRPVAIKLLSATGPTSSSRFAQEAALAQRLDHPNTVRIIDFGFGAEGLPFIVWEYLRGDTLDRFLAERGPLPAPVARKIAVQILKSLMEAHGLGIVHRDIKPPNLFITPHPGEPYFVKVLDFGIAKDTHALPSAAPESLRGGSRSFVPVDYTTGSGQTSASQLVGTPRYMAPEQAQGQRVGPETDLFALGLVMSEMLTGRKVFSQDNVLELLLEQASESPTPIPPEVVHSPLGAVVLRATQKDRARRYRSAADMLAELEAVFLRDDVTSARAPTAPVGYAGYVAHGGSPSIATLDATPATYVQTLGQAASGPTQLAPTLGGHPGVPAPPPVVARRAPRRHPAIVPAVIAVLVVGLAAPLLYVAPWASSSEKKAKADDEDERDTSSKSTKKAKTSSKPADTVNPGELPPMPNVDWSKRKVPRYTTETLKQRVVASGYEIRKAQHLGDGTGMSTEMLTITRPPCGGVVYYYEIESPQDADMIENGFKNPFRRAIRTDNRILMGALVRAEFPEGDPACTDPLIAKLTD